jgi:hypothetical protein
VIFRHVKEGEVSGVGVMRGFPIIDTIMRVNSFEVAGSECRGENP